MTSVLTPFPAGRELRVLPHRVTRNSKPFVEWERCFIEALVGLLRPGWTVYDVGAEQGEFAALAGSIVGGSRVHLFESSPTSWPSLRAIWDANDLTPPRCWHGFAGDVSTPGAAELVRSGWPAAVDGPASEEPEFAFLGERPDIPTITLDDYAEATGCQPSVIMMDVEGSESLVLEGAVRVLRAARPFVFVSIHEPAYYERYGNGQEARFAPQQEHVFRIASGARYVPRFLGYDHEAHYLFSPVEASPCAS